MEGRRRPPYLFVKMSKFAALLAAVTLAVTVRAQSTVSVWGQCGGSVSVCQLRVIVVVRLGFMLTFYTVGLDRCHDLRVRFRLHRPQLLYARLTFSSIYTFTFEPALAYSQCVPGAATTTAAPTSTSAAAAPTSSCQVPAPSAGKLRFAGVNIAGFDFGCGSDGTCNASGAWPPLTQYYGADGAGQMKHFVDDDGFNVFRLPVGWQFLTNGAANGDIDEDNWTEYDALVQACLDSGASCIVDVHNYARFNGEVSTRCNTTR